MASSALSNWGEIIRTQNLSADKEMDPVSRWLLITRASVFMTNLLPGPLSTMGAGGSRPFTVDTTWWTGHDHCHVSLTSGNSTQVARYRSHLRASRSGMMYELR